jgi:hypothetical protein
MVFSLALLVAGIPATAQAPTGSAEGHIICNDGNVPARFATVFLEPLANLLSQDNGGEKPSNFTRQSQTDFTGRYFYPSISVGTYVVHVEKAGYSDDFELVKKVLDRFTPDEKKQILSNFPQVTVTASGTASKDVVVRRGGAINGHISIDTGGLPGQAEVTATMVSSDLLGDLQDIGGKKPLHFTKTGHIDDRGIFRIAGLPAGKYRVEVRLTEGVYEVVEIKNLGGGNFLAAPVRSGNGSLTVFAPDALTESNAKLVSVGSGDELSDIDITVPMSRLHSISGTVTQGGNPLVMAALTIYRAGKKLDNSDVISTPDGRYRFDLLPPGAYTIEARYPMPTLAQRKIHTGHSVKRKITVQVMDDDVLDANIDIPAQASGQ